MSRAKGQSGNSGGRRKGEKHLIHNFLLDLLASSECAGRPYIRSRNEFAAAATAMGKL